MYDKLNFLLGSKNSKLIKNGDCYVRISRGKDEYGDFVRTETETEDKKELIVETFYAKDFSTRVHKKNYLRKG